MLNNPSRFNALEEVVQWQKFTRIKHIFDDLLTTPFHPKLLMDTVRSYMGKDIDNIYDNMNDYGDYGDEDDSSSDENDANKQDEEAYTAIPA